MEAFGEFLLRRRPRTTRGVRARALPRAFACRGGHRLLPLRQCLGARRARPTRLGRAVRRGSSTTRRAMAVGPTSRTCGVTRLVPQATRDCLGRWLTPAGYWLWARGINRVGARYGLPPLRGSELFEGDHMLLAEPEGYSETAVPPRLRGRCHFIGALVARLEVPIPKAVADMPRDLPIVYLRWELWARGRRAPHPARVRGAALSRHRARRELAATRGHQHALECRREGGSQPTR